MEEILNNLQVGDILHVTTHGIQYLFIRRSHEFSVIYSINQEQKTRWRGIAFRAHKKILKTLQFTKPFFRIYFYWYICKNQIIFQ